MTTENKENTVKKNKATKCKMCGKRRKTDDNGLCLKECAKKVQEMNEESQKMAQVPNEVDVGVQEVLDEESKAEREVNKEEQDKVRKVLALVTHLRATLAHAREKAEFAKQVKASGNNTQLLTALMNSHKALVGEARLELTLFNKCTKRRVEVVAISDPHSRGWSVEMQLPDVTNHLVLRTFQYKQVLNVKADHVAKKVCNAAAWKYFTAEEVSDTYWTEVK